MSDEAGPAPRTYRYRRDVLQALATHGVCPTDRTSPDLVRGFVRELYKYEIRRLKARLMRHEFPRPEYLPRVEALARRYGVLSLLPRQLIE